MKLTDIIELAKQGYKPSDIRELLKIETETEPQPQQDPEPEPEEQPAEDPQPEQEEQPAGDPQQEPEQDYKRLYEEEKAKRQALARKQEVAKDDNKSDEELLLDIAKMYI